MIFFKKKEYSRKVVLIHFKVITLPFLEPKCHFSVVLVDQGWTDPALGRCGEVCFLRVHSQTLFVCVEKGIWPFPLGTLFLGRL